jgi:regulator of RNase E activity RraA
MMAVQSFTNAAVFDTASVADAMDSLGLPEGWLRSLVSRSPGTRAFGSAYTVRYRIVSDHDPGFRNAANYIDDVPAGSVVVSVNPTGVACTTWGDILTAAALSRGLAGTVVAGFARDIAQVREADYPLFSTGVGMVSAKNRIELDAIQVPVEVGVTIRPGDLIVADDSGAVVVPAEHTEVVLSRAGSVESVERDIIDAVRSGATLEHARAVHGYATPWSRSLQ